MFYLSICQLCSAQSENPFLKNLVEELFKESYQYQ